MSDLRTKYLGLELKNPLLVGSCGLTGTADSILNLADKGVGGIVLKSLFEEEIIMEYEKNLKEGLGHADNNLEFLDYFDYQLKRDKFDGYRRLIDDIKSKCDVPVIASINCYSVGEWFAYAKLLEEAGVNALELNLYRIPSKIQIEAREIIESYLEIVKRVKEYVTIPVSVKISPYFTDLANVVSKFDLLGVEGVVLFNRFYSPDFDLENDRIISGPVYSSARDYANTLRWVAMLKEQVTCDLCASGGVHSADTLFKMLLAGADSVQVVSALYKNGAGFVRDLLSGLQNWMVKKNLASIQDIHKLGRSMMPENAEVFERVQFMKYFGDHN
ncbi:dihydroorotate dehydrogenase-like protein [Thermophagus xiamenensis]|uniref:Dihydroorotate dehydrogenase (Fumarate) n=1 Tax=Thermophagus xiamenensis TaxID=385682 RepID=A0A1I2BYK6_9BACT|nr:dihydroorotate dehydrogenase-like protein [Thermophagus xiamenensis]SFE61197.1 dihydroorotate dehydrogenase (fumarate) [Thermophagus xiamenensis]